MSGLTMFLIVYLTIAIALLLIGIIELLGGGFWIDEKKAARMILFSFIWPVWIGIAFCYIWKVAFPNE